MAAGCWLPLLAVVAVVVAVEVVVVWLLAAGCWLPMLLELCCAFVFVVF